MLRYPRKHSFSQLRCSQFLFQEQNSSQTLEFEFITYCTSSNLLNQHPQSYAQFKNTPSTPLWKGSIDPTEHSRQLLLLTKLIGQKAPEAPRNRYHAITSPQTFKAKRFRILNTYAHVPQQTGSINDHSTAQETPYSNVSTLLHWATKGLA